ncbi:Cytochrome p450 79a2, putative [Theobroma cacao]|uniref:Cytochrome p450 79a2, putative n=1 Tax=Theobroma cacao TaxID=3641 RepID=A0A061FSN4_THECC|nr:Cytochrome p450 79a2, putative [Theobroma cacao]
MTCQFFSTFVKMYYESNVLCRDVITLIFGASNDPIKSTLSDAKFVRNNSSYDENLGKAKGKASKRKRDQAPLSLGPTPWPIIGNHPKIWRKRPAFRWIHGLMKGHHTDILCVCLANSHVIAVTSPVIAREFLKKNDSVFASRPVTMATEYSIRRTEEAGSLVRFIYNQSTASAVVNLRLAMRQYSGNIIRKMIFNRRYFGEGRKDGGPGYEEVEHVESLFTVLQHLYSFILSDYIPWLRSFDLEGNEKTVRKAMKTVNEYQDPLIDERVQEWREGKRTEPEDLLDCFILSKDSIGKPALSIEEIKAQSCAREGFRLHPIAPFNLPHVSTADATVAGYFIPKGSHVLLSLYGPGRNPRVWDDPLKFNPERHLKVGSMRVDLTETGLRFISFNTGRRGCMGVALGTAMTMMLLARLLQGFTWRVLPNEANIDLSGAKDAIFMAKPLHALGRPRLPAHLYPAN